MWDTGAVDAINPDSTVRANAPLTLTGERADGTVASEDSTRPAPGRHYSQKSPLHCVMVNASSYCKFFIALMYCAHGTGVESELICCENCWQRIVLPPRAPRSFCRCLGCGSAKPTRFPYRKCMRRNSMRWPLRRMCTLRPHDSRGFIKRLWRGLGDCRSRRENCGRGM